MEDCGYSRILHYVENDYPGKTQNGGRWISLAVMTIIQGKRVMVVVVGYRKPHVWRCEKEVWVS